MNKLFQAFDRFLFASGSPNTCVMLRVVYASLSILYCSFWISEANQWFTDDGVMTVPTAQRVLGGSQWSLFYLLDATPLAVHTCLWLMMASCVLLLLGVYSRLQAAAIFFWMVTFHHRNPLICDGEDTVFRLFAFYLMFLPLDCRLSLGHFLRKGQFSQQVGNEAAWGLRFFQLQMSLIYFSAAWCKSYGKTWQDGSALYYVFQMGDLFGRWPLPTFVTETEWFIRFSTWAVVVVEGLLPLILWFPPTRIFGVILGIGLHLTMEYSMHLFLFQWIMIVGLLSFLNLGPRRRVEKAVEQSLESEETPSDEIAESVKATHKGSFAVTASNHQALESGLAEEAVS